MKDIENIAENTLKFLSVCSSCDGMNIVHAVESLEGQIWDIEYLNDPNCPSCGQESDLFHIR